MVKTEDPTIARVWYEVINELDHYVQVWDWLEVLGDKCRDSQEIYLHLPDVLALLEKYLTKPA
jgi:hypothetical protein